jgi:16S rRNA C1402 (ribose-2'-O) methylase RsmI
VSYDLSYITTLHGVIVSLLCTSTRYTSIVLHHYNTTTTLYSVSVRNVAQKQLLAVLLRQSLMCRDEVGTGKISC